MAKILYTSKAQIASFILLEYLEAAEQKKTGIVDRVISDVSAEIDCLLGNIYPTPFEPIPGIISYIASVLSAYRIVSSITTVVDTEASMDNPWLPLQKEWQRALKLLDDLATGVLKLKGVLPLLLAEEDNTLFAISPEPYLPINRYLA